MKRDEILERLKAERAKMAQFKVRSLAIFGSVARDEAGPGSDVDFLVEFDGPATFDQYMGLKIFLEDLLDSPVDLVTHKGVRPELAPYIEKEAFYVS